MSVYIHAQGGGQEHFYFSQVTEGVQVSTRILTDGDTEYLQVITILPSSFNIKTLSKDIKYISVKAQNVFYKQPNDFIPYKRFVVIQWTCKDKVQSGWGKLTNYMTPTPTSNNKNVYYYRGAARLQSYILNDDPEEALSENSSSFIGITPENEIFTEIWSSTKANLKPSTLIGSDTTQKIWLDICIGF